MNNDDHNTAAATTTSFTPISHHSSGNRLRGVVRRKKTNSQTSDLYSDPDDILIDDDYSIDVSLLESGTESVGDVAPGKGEDGGTDPRGAHGYHLPTNAIGIRHRTVSPLYPESEDDDGDGVVVSSDDAPLDVNKELQRHVDHPSGVVRSLTPPVTEAQQSVTPKAHNTSGSNNENADQGWTVPAVVISPERRGDDDDLWSDPDGGGDGGHGAISTAADGGARQSLSLGDPDDDIWSVPEAVIPHPDVTGGGMETDDDVWSVVAAVEEARGNNGATGRRIGGEGDTAWPDDPAATTNDFSSVISVDYSIGDTNPSKRPFESSRHAQEKNPQDSAYGSLAKAISSVPSEYSTTERNLKQFCRPGASGHELPVSREQGSIETSRPDIERPSTITFSRSTSSSSSQSLAPPPPPPEEDWMRDSSQPTAFPRPATRASASSAGSLFTNEESGTLPSRESVTFSKQTSPVSIVLGKEEQMQQYPSEEKESNFYSEQIVQNATSETSSEGNASPGSTSTLKEGNNVHSDRKIIPPRAPGNSASARLRSKFGRSWIDWYQRQKAIHIRSAFFLGGFILVMLIIILAAALGSKSRKVTRSGSNAGHLLPLATMPPTPLPTSHPVPTAAPSITMTPTTPNPTNTPTAAPTWSPTHACFDNTTATFEVNGNTQNCQWLRTTANLAMKTILCQPVFPPFQVCPVTCQTCRNNQ